MEEGVYSNNSEQTRREQDFEQKKGENNRIRAIFKNRR